MSLRPYRIPDEVFTALAAGGGGASSVRHLVAGQRGKHMVLIWGVMDRAAALGHDQAAQARRGYELLAAMEEHAPGAVESVLCHPSVGAWAMRTLQALGDERARPATHPGQLAALAASAAIRSRTPCAIDVPVIDGVVTLPSLGAAKLTCRSARGGTVSVRTTANGANALTNGGHLPIPTDPHEDAPGWLGLREIAASAGGRTIRLVIDDLDPHRMPPGTAVCSRLALAEVIRWEGALRGAWALLVKHHATTAAEIRTAVRALTPLPSPHNGQVSATSRQNFGCVALSDPADGVAFAVCLAHEVQHAKLAALLDAVALTQPDDGRRYYAPWRDDPRPIRGLLQGAYAYLGVSGFWRRQRHHEHGDAAVRAHAEFARWRAAAHMVARTLTASGRLTAAGEMFVAGMTQTLAEWGTEPVPRAAVKLAGRDSTRHRADWRRRNGAIGQL